MPTRSAARWRFSAEFQEQLQANPVAAAWFEAAPASYRRIVVNWVMSAKQETTRGSRMTQFVDDSAHGRLIKSQRYGDVPTWVARNRTRFGIDGPGP